MEKFTIASTIVVHDFKMMVILDVGIWARGKRWGLAAIIHITRGPHKAVAEVSNHNELIGRKSEIQLIRITVDFTFNCFVLT